MKRQRLLIPLIVLAMAFVAIPGASASEPSVAAAASVHPATIQTSGTFLGMNTALYGESSATQAAQLDDQVEHLHVASQRVEADWAEIQPTNSSSFNWTTLDQEVTSVRNAGMSILFLINGTPSWAAQVSSPDGQSAPANPAAFATFAAEVASRYAIGNEGFEIWNEPNNVDFWQPAANPAAYTTLLKDSYTAIHGVDPYDPVISGGLAPEVTSGGNMDAVTFLSDMYADGAKNYMDAVGAHPYSYPALPNTPESWSGWDELSYDTPSYRSVMTANGDSAKQIWITEVGYPSNTTSVNGIAGPTAEADELSQVASFVGGNSWCGPVYWYEYQDAGTDASNAEDWFGVVSASGADKPVYTTMAGL